jgi:hypothetical protein
MGFSGFNGFRRCRFRAFHGSGGFNRLSGFTTRMPLGFEAEAVDAEFFEELEVRL